MTAVTIKEAQASLPDLIRQLGEGRELVITENNKPVAKLVPAPVPASKVPQFGTLRGTVLSIEHFGDPLEEFEEYQ